jgi:hypothetical protein
VDLKARFERTREKHRGFWVWPALIFAITLLYAAMFGIVYGAIATILLIGEPDVWTPFAAFAAGLIVAPIAAELKKGMKLRRAEYRKQRLEETYSGRRPQL